jgi:hypothetical protein
VNERDKTLEIKNGFNKQMVFRKKSNRKNPKLWLAKAGIGLVLIFGYSLMPKQTTHIAERTIDAYVPGLIQSQNDDQKDISNNGSKSR